MLTLLILFKFLQHFFYMGNSCMAGKYIKNSSLLLGIKERNDGTTIMSEK